MFVTLRKLCKKLVFRNKLLTKAYQMYLQKERKALVKKNYKSKVLAEREKEFENAPLQEIFRKIYKESRWGTRENEFYSGPGSYGPITESYVEMVEQYIKQNKIASVLDLGCGDFNIGRQITNRCPEITYIGVDIFSEIIEHHNKNFTSERVCFKCVDTTSEPLPQGDLLLIREVLQHLSNASIQKIIDIQFPLFAHKIITEHHPDEAIFIKYNLDKPDGFGVRVDHGSGVYLDQPPFNLNWKELRSYPVEFGIVKSFKILDS